MKAWTLGGSLEAAVGGRGSFFLFFFSPPLQQMWELEKMLCAKSVCSRHRSFSQTESEKKKWDTSHHSSRHLNAPTTRFECIKRWKNSNLFRPVIPFLGFPLFISFRQADIPSGRRPLPLNQMETNVLASQQTSYCCIQTLHCYGNRSEKATNFFFNFPVFEQQRLFSFVVRLILATLCYFLQIFMNFPVAPALCRKCNGKVKGDKWKQRHFENWTFQNIWLKLFLRFFPSLAPASSVWLMREICSLTAVTHHTKRIFCNFFGCRPETYFTEKRVNNVRDGKKRRMVFLECRHCRVAVNFFFIFCIGPSARDYSPRWLWITCGGLARSPVTKSFWRISRLPTHPHRHSATAFFLFLFPVSLATRVQVSAAAKVTLWAKNKRLGRVGRSGAHVTICLWLAVGVWLVGRAASDPPGGIIVPVILLQTKRDVFYFIYLFIL